MNENGNGAVEKVMLCYFSWYKNNTYCMGEEFSEEVYLGNEADIDNGFYKL